MEKNSQNLQNNVITQTSFKSFTMYG